MRISIALVLAGEVIALLSIAVWSPEIAGVLLGVQLAALGLLRELREEAKAKAKRPIGTTAGVHRRRAALRRVTDRARPALKLIRGAA